MGLTLGTTAPKIFRALVEATAFGSRAIVEQFRKEGVPINAVIAQGGIARKSPFVMQVTADVLGMPIRVVASDQACALGRGHARGGRGEESIRPCPRPRRGWAAASTRPSSRTDRKRAPGAVQQVYKHNT